MQKRHHSWLVGELAHQVGSHRDEFSVEVDKSQELLQLMDSVGEGVPGNGGHLVAQEIYGALGELALADAEDQVGSFEAGKNLVKVH